MSTWVWVLIVVGVIAVVAVVAWVMAQRRKREHLQNRFGPEYDRAVEGSGSRRKAEAELAAREDRREKFTLRPLSPSARARYVESWRVVQAQVVDDPRAAVAAGDSLIQSVMRERGYPVEDFDQRAADISVDHPAVVEHYREGHRLAVESANGDDSTEALRRAMQHYRTLFEELVDADAAGDDAPDNSQRPTAVPGEVR
jgi:hypothetical protein